MISLYLQSFLAIMVSSGLDSLDVVSLLVSLMVLDVGDLSLITIKDTGDLLKSGALGLNVEEVDKYKLDGDPDLWSESVDSLKQTWGKVSGQTYSVEAPEVPVVREVVKSNGVGLVADGKSDLDEEVHDHQATGTKTVGQDLEGVGNEKTGPGDRVEDIEEPDESDLGVAEVLDVLLATLLEASGHDGPGKEHAQHTL